MHESVVDFVKRAVRKVPAGARVVELGALDINGGVRHLFADAAEYVGVDLEDGPGVDLVHPSWGLTFDPRWDAAGDDAPPLEAGVWDVVLCLEMLEHDERPWDTARELYRLARPGGLVLVSARGNGFPEHNRPDRWRFLRDGLKGLLEGAGLTVKRIADDPQVSGWLVTCVRPEVADGK